MCFCPNQILKILTNFKKIAVGPMGKAPSAIKTNIKAAGQMHPYNR